MSKAQLVKIQDSIDYSVSEIAREARKLARRAQLSGDHALQQEILRNLDVAEEKRREVEERLMVAALSSDEIDSLIKTLSEKKDVAKRLLASLRERKKSLETVKKVAEGAANLLGSFAKIV